MYKITSSVGINIYIPKEGEEITLKSIKDDFAFVLCGEGIFAKRKNFLYEGFFKVDKADFIGTIKQEVVQLIDLKIPHNLFLSIEKFFQRIYDKMKTEVQCFLYYNTDTKKWAYCVPQQTVNGASVDYDEKKGATYIHEDTLDVGLDNLPNEGTWIKVGTVHSHASMTAFHSGTDDKDEFGFDGIHITIGSFNSKTHTYAARIMYGKVAIKKEIEEVVDYPTISGRFPEKLEYRVSQPTYPVCRSHAAVSYADWEEGGPYIGGYQKYPRYSDFSRGEYPYRTNTAGFQNKKYESNIVISAKEK